MCLPDYIEKLKSIVATMEADYYHTSETATIQVNAPLALMQLSHNTKLQTLKSVIKDLEETRS